MSTYTTTKSTKTNPTAAAYSKKASAKKPAAKAVKAAARITKATPKAEKRDAFGSSLGTKRAKINAALSNTPKTTKELTMASKAAPRQVVGQMRLLVSKGLVVKTDKGYALKAKKAAKKAG